MKYKNEAIEILEEFASSYSQVDVERLAAELEHIEKRTAAAIIAALLNNTTPTFDKDGKPIIKIDADFALNTCKKYGIRWAEE